MEASDGWRGWDFWRVVTIGGISPKIVLTEWTLADVWEYSYHLQVRTVLEAIP